MAVNKPKRRPRPTLAPESKPKRSPTRSPKSPSPRGREKRWVRREGQRVTGQPQVGGEVHHHEVGLDGVDLAVVGRLGVVGERRRALGASPGRQTQRRRGPAPSKREPAHLVPRASTTRLCLHVAVPDAAVLRARDVERARPRVGHEARAHRRAALGDLHLHLELLDRETMDAVGRTQGEAHLVALRHLDDRGSNLKREAVISKDLTAGPLSAGARRAWPGWTSEQRTTRCAHAREDSARPDAPSLLNSGFLKPSSLL